MFKGSVAMWKQDFIRCLEESTLGSPRIGESLAIKRAYLPKRIYKYRRDCADSRSNLRDGTIWLSSPDSCNDPYDCAFATSEEVVVRAFKKRLVDDFVKTYHLETILSSAQVEDAKRSPDPLRYIAEHISEPTTGGGGSNPKRMAEFCSMILPRSVHDVVSVLRLWRKVTKLCCFSAINDSLLMWTHYADNHKGYCIEYDLEALNEDHAFRTNLYPVISSAQLYDLTALRRRVGGPRSPAVQRRFAIIGGSSQI